MGDQDCVAFLQWALPRLSLQWTGFRRVRTQVCKRIVRRMASLGLVSFSDYRRNLDLHTAEWAVLDSLCRVTITRFYRDKAVYAFLEHDVLPAALQRVRSRGETVLRVWSAGCASGEEPYTLSLIWVLALQRGYPDLRIAITATDADAELLQRAELACYPFSSVKGLPPLWRNEAFSIGEDGYCLDHRYRGRIEWLRQDLRESSPQGPFDLVLCRNLAFTYFDPPLQAQVLARLDCALAPGGSLVIGIHERLPASAPGFVPWSPRLGVYAKVCT